MTKKLSELILDHFRKRGKATRFDLAMDLGISMDVTSTNLSKLAKMGLIEVDRFRADHSKVYRLKPKVSGDSL